MTDLEKLAREWLETHGFISDEKEPNDAARDWIFHVSRLIERQRAAGRIEGLKEAEQMAFNGWRFSGATDIRARIRELEAE